MKKNQWDESTQIVFALIDYFRISAGTQTNVLSCDKDGNPSTDPLKVNIEEPTFRMAESNEDFEIILDKEFQKSKFTDKHIFQIRQLEIFKENREILTKSKDNEPEIDLIDRYIKFLQCCINTVGTQKEVKSFPDFLIDPDPVSLAQKIKKEFIAVPGSGKHSAALFTVLKERGLFRIYSTQQVVFDSMTLYFGNIGNIKGFNSYLSENHNNHKSIVYQDLIKDYSEKLYEIVNSSHY